MHFRSLLFLLGFFCVAVVQMLLVFSFARPSAAQDSMSALQLLQSSPGVQPEVIAFFGDRELAFQSVMLDGRIFVHFFEGAGSDCAQDGCVHGFFMESDDQVLSNPVLLVSSDREIPIETLGVRVICVVDPSIQICEG